MSNKQVSGDNQDFSEIYEIRLKGHLNDRWSDAFENLTITHDAKGNSILTLQGIDQSALFGLLRRIRDSGVFLLSINCGENNTSDKTDSIKKE